MNWQVYWESVRVLTNPARDLGGEDGKRNGISSPAKFTQILSHIEAPVELNVVSQCLE